MLKCYVVKPSVVFLLSFFFFFFFRVHHDDLHDTNMSEKTVKLINNILKLIALHWFQLLLVHNLKTISKLLKFLFDPLTA